MKNIVVPTDFSACSKNAFRYAMSLAEMCGANVNVVHIYHPPALDAIRGANALKKEFQSSVRRLKRFVGGYYPESTDQEVQTAVDLRYEAVAGLAVDEIIRISEEPETDLIVMGTLGTTGLLKQLLGGISSAITRGAHCPVLLVPNNVSWKGVHNLLYAVHSESIDPGIITKASQLAKTLCVKSMHLVHVSTGPASGSQELELAFRKMFEEKAPEIDLRMCVIRSPSVENGINTYAVNHDIQMAVVVTRHRHFPEEWLHTSMTKRMSLGTQVPLLVLHSDDPR